MCQETKDGEDPEKDDSVFLFHSFTVLRYTTAKLRSFPFAQNPYLWRFLDYDLIFTRQTNQIQLLQVTQKS
jgi:hypothetical protein